MNEKNNCSYTDRSTELNTFANELYSPKKETVSQVLKTSTNQELKDKLNSNLLTKYSSFTKCPNNGFFVAKPDDNKNIYVLDSNQNEVDKINLNVPNSNYTKTIKAIAYDPELSKLYIANKDNIYSTNNQGDFIKEEITPQTLNSISTTTTSSTKTNPCISPTSTTITTPNIQTIGIADNNILVAYNQNNSNFLAKLTPNGNLVHQKHIDDNTTPNTIFETTSGIHILSKKDNTYDYLHTYDKKRSDVKKHCCEIILNGECRVDIECDANWPCDLDTSLCEVIRSVALIENALAKLINCESDKIKEAIHKSKCTKDLVDINTSVSKTINTISILEQTLKEKLETALEIYKETKHEKPHHHKYHRPCN